MRRWMSSLLYARAGAILPKIPDDVMTLVQPEESGNNPRETKRMERRLHPRPTKEEHYSKGGGAIRSG
jgi:hypothetical protein